MPAYGVSVEKSFTFRGAGELTSNIYHYSITAPLEVDYDNLADAVVERDKAAHTSGFTYKTVRVFGPTEGPKEDNKMRLVKDLTGNGVRTGNAPALYPELTACVQIYVGRSPVKNRKVFVRKFIHLLAAATAAGVAPESGLLTAAEKTFWQNWMDSLKTVTRNAVSYSMVTPRDRDVPDNTAAQCLNFARIRQLHQ